MFVDFNFLVIIIFAESLLFFSESYKAVHRKNKSVVQEATSLAQDAMIDDNSKTATVFAALDILLI